MKNEHKFVMTALLFLLSCAWSVPVQGGMGSTLSYEYFPYSGIADLPAGSPLADMDIRYSKSSVNLNLPLLTFNRGITLFINSLYAENIALTSRNRPAGGSPTEVDRLIGIDYALTWLQFWAPEWKTTLTIKPGIYYDGDSASGNIYRVQGNLCVWKKVSSTLGWGVGGGVSNEFGEPTAVPILLLKFNSHAGEGNPKPGDHLVELNLPVNGSYFYAVAGGFHLGAAAQISGGNYRLTEGAFDGKSVRFSVGTIGPAARFFFGNRFSLELGGGVTFHRRFDVRGGVTFHRRFDVRDGDTNVVDFELKNSGFARLTANARF